MSIDRKEKERIFAAASPKIVDLPLRGNLEARNNDEEDFLTVSVWELEAALEEAYRLGLSDGRGASIM